MCQALNQMLGIEIWEAQSLLPSCLQFNGEDRKQTLHQYCDTLYINTFHGTVQ